MLLFGVAVAVAVTIVTASGVVVSDDSFSTSASAPIGSSMLSSSSSSSLSLTLIVTPDGEDEEGSFRFKFFVAVVVVVVVGAIVILLLLDIDADADADDDDLGGRAAFVLRGAKKECGFTTTDFDFAADCFFVIVVDDVEFLAVLPEAVAVETVDFGFDFADDVDAADAADDADDADDDAIDFHFLIRAIAFGPKIGLSCFLNFDTTVPINVFDNISSVISKLSNRSNTAATNCTSVLERFCCPS